MKKVKILYVEDEPFLAKIVKESLESRDYNVLLLSDGRKVIDTFTEWQPDVCILDVMLPFRDGFELGAAIRKRNPTIPILFVTAKNETEDVLKGFSVGGNDYIRKPFSMEELVVRITNLLLLSGNSEGETPAEITEIQLGAFLFSPEKLALQHPENPPIQLSYREGQILALLCQHRNGTLERKDLLLSVWGDDSFFNSRNLDVYIRKLRTYLAVDENISILTLKGVGYRFMVEE
jgi:DNA-binding response OmpR family regulator